MSIFERFELIKEQEISELNSRARIYRHKETGARLLSLENDDENKVFGITFRTPADDSTGIAHIMEHSVLCGSRKYPVKEPFVELIKGSLNTFLNAFTYPDKTCYPVASTNLQDFYNLVDVYLDAVFYPNLTPNTLKQEGWHYELESSSEPMRLQGVVFNEMKGNYSSPDRLLGEYSQQVIFPDNTYQHDSGGDPRHIPALTWEQFQNFHKTYYHPSNSFIYFYGDDPLEKRLEIVEAYLKDFRHLEPNSDILLQSKFAAPKRVTKKYPAGEEDKEKAMVTLNWLLDENNDARQVLALSVLNHILLGTAASPLRKALIESGYGEDVTGGMETELRQMFFSAGLKGVLPANIDKAEQLVIDTLQELATGGIERDAIEASLNTFEFRLRENNTGSYPRGLVIMLRALAPWLYGGDPLKPLAFEALLDDIKQRLQADPRFFESLIQQHLLGNQHRVTLIMEPDTGLSKQEEQQEQQRLHGVRAKMSDAEVQQVVTGTAELKAWQQRADRPEDLAKIPSLRLSDIERENPKIPIEVSDYAAAKILYHDLFTNGIVYFAVGFDLHRLPQELIPYLPLFSRSLIEMGTETQNYVQLAQRIGRKTGGVSPTIYSLNPQGTEQALAMLMVRGKAMPAQADDMLDIIRDITLTVNLDNRERFRQMALEERAGEESSIVPGGHQVVGTRLRALFDEYGWLGEEMGGINYLFFLRRLLKQIDSDWPGVLANLQRIRELVFNRDGAVVNVTLDRENWAQVQPKVQQFLQAYPAQKVAAVDWRYDPGSGFEGLTIPAQVNYVGKAASLYDLGYQFHGSALVINKFLRTTWLWDRVRVQGGAYGAFSKIDRRAGVFTFISYRDPNLLKTLENYDLASQFLRSVSLSREEIDRSIIGTISDLDSYKLPDAKGYTSMAHYLSGDTDADLQRIRDEVLSTTEVHFRQFAEVLDAFNKQAYVIVLGAEDTIAAVNREKNDWLQVVKVL